MQVVGVRKAAKKLVVVADNSLIVEAIAIGLRNSGEFELLGHVNGRTGSMRAAVEARPDAVLVDDMDAADRAVEVVREIRAEDDGIAVIVLTASMDVNWLDTVFEAGAVGAISKVTQPAALVTLVRETLNGNVLHLYKRFDAAPRALPTAVMVEHSPLTTREIEVLRLVASGSTNGEIARKLWVTEQTVKFHLSNVYRKLGVGNRTEASNYAHANGLVEPMRRAPAYVS